MTLYRNYRMGDFPDIQITYSSLITPLQALSQVGLLPVILRMEITRQELRKVNYFPAHLPSERSSCSQTVVQLPVCWHTSRDGNPEIKSGKCENEKGASGEPECFAEQEYPLLPPICSMYAGINLEKLECIGTDGKRLSFSTKISLLNICRCTESVRQGLNPSRLLGGITRG